MGGNHKLEYSDFLNRFFAVCEKQFYVLEELDFNKIYGLVHYRNMSQIIEPYNGQSVELPIIVVCRYEKDEIALEIKYDSAQYCLEALIYYHWVHRLSWQDLINPHLSVADRIDPHFQVHLSSLVQKIEQYRDLLRGNIKTLTNPDPKRVDEALKVRAKLIEQQIRKTYKENLDQACQKAAKAFVLRDYKMVIELLTPYRSDLRAAELKKLVIAKRRLLEPVQ